MLCIWREQMTLTVRPIQQSLTVHLGIRYFDAHLFILILLELVDRDG
jgi:hypothetical protein